MARPLKRSEIEEHIDWTRVGPDELSLVEQLDGATNGDHDKILRELTRRGVLQMPENAGDEASGVDESMAHAAGGDPVGMVRSLFGRFFAE